jgi:hypothetical protein
MHILTSNSLSNNPRAISTKAFSSTYSITYQNVLSFPTSMVTSRTLTLLKCRAAKKFKTNLFNIALNWKVCSSNFNFEEAFTSPDLCLMASSKLYDDFSIMTGEFEKN